MEATLLPFFLLLLVCSYSVFRSHSLHDLLKRGYREAYQQEPGVAASLWCGVAAAWTGQMVAFPLETVSRRMQLAGTTQLAAAAAAAGGSSSAAAAGAAGAGAGAAVPGGVCAATAAAAAGTHGMLAVVQNITREAGPAALYRWERMPAKLSHLLLVASACVV